MKCKNCGHSVNGKFCSHCGQKITVGRITFASFITEISESIFKVNQGFFYTLKELFIRPGKSLNEFLDGKRRSHFKPIAYLLVLSTAYYIITQVTDQSTWMGDLVTGWMTGAREQGSSGEISEVVGWFLKNYAYLALFLVPVFSLASYLSFFKYRRTFPEHIVINSYITGQQAIIYTFFTIVASLCESVLTEVLPLVLAVLYTFLVYWQLFRKGNRILNLLRSTFTYILYSIFSAVLLALLV